MLFVFERAGQQCFWMKNTLIPLSIAFLADDGSIVNIDSMKPQTLEPHCSEKPVRYRPRDERGLVREARHQGRQPRRPLRGQPFANQRSGRGPRAQAKFFAAKSQLASELRKVSTHFGRWLR